jgi:hypothetical protein
MSDPVEPLIVDLLEWIARAPRPYAEVMEVWRTSCPRLPVWEEANARGFLEQRHVAGSPAVVVITEAGLRRLEERTAARGGAQPARSAIGAAPPAA